MSDNKLHKYESDSSLPSLRIMLVEKKSKGMNIPSESRLRTEFRSVQDKRNAVSRLISFFKDQY